MNAKKVIKNLMFICTLGVGQTISACCGCSIVNGSMTSLETTTTTALKTLDEALTAYFEYKVTAENDRYLNMLKVTPKDVEDISKINKQFFIEYDKILYDIKKETSTKLNYKKD